MRQIGDHSSVFRLRVVVDMITYYKTVYFGPYLSERACVGALRVLERDCVNPSSPIHGRRIKSAEVERANSMWLTVAQLDIRNNTR